MLKYKFFGQVHGHIQYAVLIGGTDQDQKRMECFNVLHFLISTICHYYFLHEFETLFDELLALWRVQVLHSHEEHVDHLVPF